MFPRGVCTRFSTSQLHLVLKQCKSLTGQFHTGSAESSAAEKQHERQQGNQLENQQDNQQETKSDSDLATKENSEQVQVLTEEQMSSIQPQNEAASKHPDLWKNPIDMRILPKKYKFTDEEKKMFQLSTYIFHEIGESGKNKRNFLKALAIYKKREKVYNRGLVEFLSTGLDNMKEWGVHKDKEVYKAMIGTMPQEKFLPKSKWMAELGHYPKQQQCAIDILEKMQNNGVIPDEKMEEMIEERFGISSYVMRKYTRMLYWMPKFRHANPYPVPWQLTDDPIQLAIIALKRMAIDLNNKITVWKTAEVEEIPLEDTFIVSAQSPDQAELISAHSVDVPLVVEGSYSVWLRHKQQHYFVLKSDQGRPHAPAGDVEDDSEVDWTGLNPYLTENEDDQAVLVPPSIHCQDDGTVMATCITGTSSRDSVVTWIRYLQQSNPKLEHIPILFSIKTHTGQLDVRPPT
ncbi:evolutionarily conserved signaling intermediate in Toll pathway, mitochondrial-like isoform X2 [Mizuhopecten yessoensis]|nr:evolutionarily conserved signaling intermediate in Toll pathway, mitochondrial-like isoform X2 [Mizuhopecten yessoensis]XP_021379523.1 evolutionarily conserved signaling intermediate in Toll pathway, mitochondrial-like isoform X2 [Mizuhopecten yessoensis]XP_021379524.1 evolutionarily conserved signaling intermediate in Toll pathway, mitochondrial-like isoform X2 [Mizuhopecten yessoensis]